MNVHTRYLFRLLFCIALSVSRLASAADSSDRFQLTLSSYESFLTEYPLSSSYLVSVHQDGNVKLKYLQSVPGIDPKKISGEEPVESWLYNHVDLSQDNAKFHNRRASYQKRGELTSKLQNLLAVYDGNITRVLLYPEQTTLQAALDPSLKPIGERRRKGIINELESDLSPIGFLKTIFEVKSEEDLSHLVDNVMPPRASHPPVITKAGDGTTQIEFDNEITGSKTTFLFNEMGLPLKKLINGNRGLDTEIEVVYTANLKGSKYPFPQKMSYKTYFTTGGKRMLMLERSFSLEMIKPLEPSSTLFNLSNIPEIE